MFLVLPQYQDRCATSKALFIGEGCTPVDLQTQVIPFLALANVPLHDPGACFHILGTLILKMLIFFQFYATSSCHVAVLVDKNYCVKASVLRSVELFVCQVCEHSNAKNTRFSLIVTKAKQLH